MTDDVPSPLALIRTNLYRTLRGTTAARGDPAMAALALEVGILEAIRDLDAILSPQPTSTTRFSGKGAMARARRKAAETA